MSAISYTTGFVPTGISEAVFRELMKLHWLQVTEARKEYFMSDVERKYTYSKREYTSKPYSFWVMGIQRTLNTQYKTNFNVCFLNRYDDGKNQLGWHADDSPEMNTDHPIAVVSFGAAREIWWKKKDYKGVIPREQRILLEDGSLFLMPAHFQEDHLHRIPRADRICGTRISLTFRNYIEVNNADSN